MRRLTAVLSAACVLVFLSPAIPPASAACTVPTFTYKHGVVTFMEGGAATRVQVEIADTEDAREVGLMCRSALAPDTGMLFVFADVTRDPFWMKDTLIPLSIAFIDNTGHIVGLFDMAVAADPENGPFPTYGPKNQYRYALEVNEGFFTQHDIDAKAKVTFTP